MTKKPTDKDRCVSCHRRLEAGHIGFLLLGYFYCEDCSWGLIYPTMMADPQALATQYQEVNERSRWYTTAMWQVPTATVLAYAVAVSFATGIDNGRIRGLVFLGLGLFAVLILNAFVTWSWLGAKATRHIREMEALLGIFPTALDAREVRRATWRPIIPVDQWDLWAFALFVIAFGLSTFGTFEAITGR